MYATAVFVAVLCCVARLPMTSLASDDVMATRFRVLRAPNGTELCAASPPSNVTRSRSRLDCVNVCQRDGGVERLTCEAVNYRHTNRQCEMFYYEPTQFSVDTDCVLLQNQIEHKYTTTPQTTVEITTCDPGATYSLIPAENCSFPFSYNYQLYYNCTTDMAGVSSGCSSYACFTTNRTAAICNWNVGFTAEYSNIGLALGNETVLARSIFDWIIIFIRLNSSDYPQWYRSWTDYKSGFGSMSSQSDAYWFGLEKMHQMTTSADYRMRVEVQDRGGILWFSEEYWSIKIGDELTDQYRLQLAGATGDAGDAFSSSDPAFHQNGMSFYTYDSPVSSPGNCPTGFLAGWWFNRCMLNCLTCVRPYFIWYGTGSLLFEARMMIKPQ